MTREGEDGTLSPRTHAVTAWGSLNLLTPALYSPEQPAGDSVVAHVSNSGCGVCKTVLGIK